jgi:NTE family protein
VAPPDDRDAPDMSHIQHHADLFFDGGGVKAIALAGAYSVFEEHGYAAHRVAGCSGGAIIAALVAAGYMSADIQEIVGSAPFERFKDLAWTGRVLGPSSSYAIRRGLYRGEYFLAWIGELLAARGITRFGDLEYADAEDPAHRYRLCVIASDLTHRRMLVLPQDAPYLGVDPSDLEIAYAVRMSMSIPIVFEPVVHRNVQTGAEHVIVDGGVLSHLPVWLFDCRERDPRWPTFGVVMVESNPATPLGQRIEDESMASNTQTALGSLADTLPVVAQAMMDAHQRLYIEESNFARTVCIPALGVGTMELDVTPARVQDLFLAGQRAAADFLAHWDFEAYAQSFRRDAPPSRREDVSGPRLAPAPLRASVAEDPDAADVVPDGIFINYRREDVPWVAAALHTEISETFGADRTFMDVDSIRPGADWETALFRALRRTQAMLVVIGSHWLTKDGGSSRLDDPDDWVRREIEEALQRAVRVVPVLVDGAVFPTRSQLPEALTGLLRRQRLEVKASTRLSDVANVIATLKRIDDERESA